MSSAITSLPAAIALLQTSTISSSERINALRYLQLYVSNNRKLDKRTRKNINELVYENVLKMIMSEDNTADLRRRQLIRTECFLMLANLLGSNALFGDAFKKIEEDNKHNELVESANARQMKINQQLDTQQQTIQLDIENDDLENDNNIENKDTRAKDDNDNIHTPIKSPIRQSISAHSYDRNSPKNSPNSSPTKKSLPLQEIGSSSPDFVRLPGSPTRRPAAGPPGGWVRDHTLTPTPDKNMNVLKIKSFGNEENDSTKINSPEKSIMKKRLKKMLESAAMTKALESPYAVGNKLITKKVIRNSSSEAKLDVLKAALTPHDQLRLEKKFRPRPSVFFGSNYESDDYYPGIDQDDWIEQDKKLGYQKSRMWVPVPKIGINASLTPAHRPLGGLKPDQVVEEYLQMRALISYVGDLVTPKTEKKLNDLGKDYVTGGIENRLRDKMNHLQFNSAMKEAIKLWTPLVGAHIPSWAQKKRTALNSIEDSSYVNNMNDNDADGFLDEGAGEHNDGEIGIIFTKDSLRKLLRREILSSKQAVSYFNENLEELVENNINGQSIQKYQQSILSSYNEQKRSLMDSAIYYQQLSHHTIKLQRSTVFPTKYMAVVDGSKASFRDLVMNMIDTFCRIRSRNFLVVAFGTWKIGLIRKDIERKNILYHKKAALYLMRNWGEEMKLKFVKVWMSRWKKQIVRIIYSQRNRAVLPIQTKFRQYIKRKLFLMMHDVAPYNGQLSDIYLGPYRNLRFEIPRRIRDHRRSLFFAATIVQSQFRSYAAWLIYVEKRNKLILIQSLARMFPTRKKFLRLKRWTIKAQAWARGAIQYRKYNFLKLKAIVIQKYVRRYSAILWKIRQFYKMWAPIEKRMAAVIPIQKRIRIRRAKKVPLRIQRKRDKFIWGVLFVQRNWYRIKGAYHTFVLMRTYQARELEDQRLEDLATTMGRHKCARKIQRLYKERFFKKNVSAAVTIGCWWRGRQGYGAVDILRKRKWASRKLHHWARGMMKRKHAFVRKIQNWWWNLKPGRRRRHLHYLAKKIDDKKEFIMFKLTYYAASRMQAIVRGVMCRRWIKRHKAALVIQKPLRFYLARQRWKTWKRRKIRAGVSTYVSGVMERAKKDITVRLVRKHSKMLIQPQKWIRGFIIRSKMDRLKKLAYRYGLAIITVQRFWRKAGAVTKAVQEVLALKRKDTNQFRLCDCIHKVVVEAKMQAIKYYSIQDCRSGMLISGLLYRMGYSNLSPMFPTKKYRYVSDLKVLTLENLVALYLVWIKAEEKRAAGKKDDKPKKKKREPEVPMHILTEIHMIAHEEKVVRPFKQYESIKNITSIPEIISGEECEVIITKEFNKRFDPTGTKYPARAKNISKAVIEMAWNKYNNYKTVAQVITIDHIRLAIKTSPNAKKIEDTLKTLIDQYVTIKDERTYNNARMEECARLLSAAMDWIKMITPPGVIYDMLDKTAAKVAAYERKFAFLLERDKNKVSQQEPEKAVYEAFKEEESRYKLDTNSTTTSFYEGPLEFASIEANVSICKLYLEVFDKLYVATKGMQKFKTHWVNGAARRLQRKLKLQKFLNDAKSEYMKEKTSNHVEVVWKKFLKRDTIQRKTQDIIEAAAARRAAIEESIAEIDKYGWEKVTDEDGVVYYYDNTRREESVFQKPVYKFKDNQAVKVVQRLARIFLEKLAEIRRQKEAARLKEIELMSKKMLVSLQAVETKVTFAQRDLEALIKDGVQYQDEDVSIESLMPWTLRLSPISNPRPGVWALMPMRNQLFAYESVLIFNIKKTKNKVKCSVKNIKGEITKGVEMKKLLEMNYDKEYEIECRPKRQLFYYKAYINKIKMTHLGEIVYDVRYRDGDFEENMSREYIRPDPENLKQLGIDRQKVFENYKNQKIRKDHFLAIKHKRLQKLQQSLIKAGGAFANAWVDMNNRFKKQRSIQGISENTQSMKDLFSQSASITYAKMESSIKINYSRTCTKYGWEKTLLADGKPGYKNLKLMKVSKDPPRYNAEEQFSVIKIQSAWRTKLVNDRIKLIMIQNPLDEIALKAIDDYKKEAFVGYKYEGVNPALLLCRLGLWDVAANVLNFYKDRPKDLQAINALDFIECPKEQHRMYGIVQFEDVKKFTDLQIWWKRQSVEKRDIALSFVNYYSSYEDSRSITKCIRESEDKVLQILIAAFPSSTTRTKQSAKVIFESLFPHTQKQIDTVIKKYAENPELFREKLIELKNKPTTNTWEEEEKAFKVLNRACFKLSALLARMKLKNIKRFVDTYREEANEIIDSIPDKRVPTSGPEARAAFILRSKVLTYILECSKAVVIIQKRIRGFCKRNNFCTRRRNRYKAVTAIQRCFRCNKARELARKLRRLQKAAWEQLWDKTRNMLYYYNRLTNVSQYLEPTEDFRPLVRDRRSAALVQAWPFLDSDHTRHIIQTDGQTVAVAVPSNIPDLKLCDICKVRNCARLCLDCGTARSLKNDMVSNVVPYCFPCYNQLHSDDLSFRNHRYTDTTERNVVALCCTICEQAATRKCQGILNEASIESILDQIQVARPENWNKILKKANICDDRKISMLLQNIKSLHRDSKIILSSAELQHLRTTLERLRAECDECYCSACYIESHTGGRRSLHKWIGFNPNAAICSICLRSPGEKTCQDCDNSSYCNSCFKVFHGMGKKRKHRNYKLLEEMMPSDVLCLSCERRAGYYYCSNPGCDFIGCDSCYECNHVSECKFAVDVDAIDENAPYVAPGAPVCTVCGYAADTKCNRCGDFYCSRVWMGNEGCFQQHHSKGFRISHRQITLEVPKEDWEMFLE